MADARTTGDDVDALIERIVREARIASARERDALRRELADHFEDAVLAEGGRDAHAVSDPRTAGPPELRTPALRVIARFGSVEEIAEGFRRAHRPGRRALYAAKVIGSVVVATLVALALQLPLHLERSAGAIAVAPLYVVAVRVSIFAVLAAVAAWELDVESFCTRLERDPIKLVAACLALFVVLSAAHAALGMDVPVLRAFVGATTMLAVWTSTLAIVARSDRAFLRAVGGGV
jgi:hypothetical protein